MTARARLVRMLFVATVSCVFAAGCGDDDPVAPGNGSVTVSVFPDTLDANWLLTGRGGFVHEGQGQETLDELDTGDYTVLWQDADGWVAPAFSWGSLEAGETLQLSGTYVQQGTVVIDILPSYLEPMWTLTGPDGYEENGQGEQVVPNVDPGEYTVAFGDLSGWETPDSRSHDLTSGGMITLSGTYLVVPAATPDEAVQMFRATYSGRQLGRYSLLLHDDFQFIDQNGGSDNRAQEIAIADQMFHGEEGQNGLAISDITIDRLDPQGVWNQTPANDPVFGAHPGSMYRQYLVDIKFHIAAQYLILRVQGPALIYAENVDQMDYRILGIVDATYGNKATENHTWSNVRSLFD